MESPSQDESQQVKLRRNLIQQFKRDELSEITGRFMEILVQNNPHLEKNPEKIVDYLVNVQRNDDELLGTITRFLQIADEFSETQVNIELAKDMFAYLLQTLVNEPEVNTRGVNWVSVNYIPTVKLIYAAEKGIAVVPDYQDQDLEYKAGKRNARFEYIGHFKSRNAQWAVESVCEEIAEKLLKTLRETRRSPKGSSLSTLRAKLIHAKVDPVKSPLHGIFIDAKYLSKHPFNNTQVVQHFMEMTDGRLPIYIYRVEQSPNGFKNIKIDEDDLMFFLEGDYKLLKEDFASKSEKSANDKGSSVNTFENNKNIYIYQNNNYITLDQQHIEQLEPQISQLKQEIHQKTDIAEQDCNEIMRAIQILEQAMENQGNIEKTQLSDLGRIFEFYKDTFGFAGSIASIISVFF